MATTVKKYVDGCEEIVKAKPEYEKGASSLTKCDCIGMDKYSFRKNGVKFSTTGTNYSFRYQIDNARKISSASDLNVGDVVFKANAPDSPNWDLPAKYQKGGSQYNGDLNDYYHIGTVKSVSPLKIMHMTSPTSKVDTSLGHWEYAGNWKKEYISDVPEPEPIPDPDPEPGPEPEPEPEIQLACVASKNGKPVNTRKGPDETYSLSKAGKIECGSLVEILEKTINKQGEEWCKIRWIDPNGAAWICWMKGCFLVPLTVTDPVEPVAETYTVHIPCLTSEQAQDLIDRYPGAWKTEENNNETEW